MPEPHEPQPADPAGSPTAAVVRDLRAGEVTRWDDERRGRLSFTTLIDGARDQGVLMCVGVAELERGDWLAMHRHPHPETYHVLAGSGLLTAGGTVHELVEGSSVYLPGGIPHGVRTEDHSGLRFLYTFPTASLADVEYEWLPAH